ncbi:MAG: cyclic-di-AMP receptor [Anaerolineales bacterium]|nr:cyclic-di-AMP receptor [Anaerolineales bacterium]
MKMIMAIVPKMEAESVLDHLVDAGFTATYMESRGRIMRQSQLTLYIAVSDANVETVMNIIRENCHSKIRINPVRRGDGKAGGEAAVQADVGGAVIFLWSLDAVRTG